MELPMVCSLIALIFLLLSCLAQSSPYPVRCRCLPTQSCWPSSSMWSALNASVNGRLIAARPAAAVCHDPFYDAAACKVAQDRWTSPFWRSDQPGGLQAPNNEMEPSSDTPGCLPGGAAGRSSSCAQGTVPIFAVNVGGAQHVQRAIAFAAQHNLRLVVKNTGHEFTGKNTGRGALSLWMHNLKSITFGSGFTPRGCRAWGWWRRRYAAVVKVGAGVQWEELYKAAEMNGRMVIVGAQCSSVGAAGGYAQGGGHSQIAPSFGLAADNVVEMEVVLPDGSLITANECDNAAIFWALRGGGGGTFGIAVSTTYIAHPPLRSLAFASYSISAPDPSSFKRALAAFIRMNPSLSFAGWGGNFLLGANNTLTISYLLPNRDPVFASKSFAPLLATIQAQGCSFTGGIKSFPSYYQWHLAAECPGGVCGFPSGSPLVESSRLVPSFTAQYRSSQLADALIAIKALGYARVSVYLVGGGKVSIPQNNAVNPAWRNAIFHVLIAGYLPDMKLETRRSATASLSSATDMLRALTPGSGSYLNEADASEPNWQHSFFGFNYPRLRAIKAMVDPKGLLACRHCVGSEDWSEDLNCRMRLP